MLPARTKTSTSQCQWCKMPAAQEKCNQQCTLDASSVSCAEIGLRSTVQTGIAVQSLGCYIMIYLLQHLIIFWTLLVRNIAQPTHPDALELINRSIELHRYHLNSYLKYMNRSFLLDHLLHNITPLKETQSLVFSKRRNIFLNTTWNYQECMYHTKLRNDQIIRVYRCFDLRGYILAQNEDYARVSTGGFNQRRVSMSKDKEGSLAPWPFKYMLKRALADSFSRHSASLLARLFDRDWSQEVKALSLSFQSFLAIVSSWSGVLLARILLE